MGPQARLLLDYLFTQDPLFAEAGLTALEMGSARHGPRGPAGEVLARYLAEQMRGETRIASLSLSGFDTHQWQKNRLRPALRNLQTTLLTLRAELGPLWARTTVLALTEFGRTARENGTGGTDHGTGGMALLAGGALRGGRMIGGWPGLVRGALYAGRDLMPLQRCARLCGLGAARHVRAARVGPDAHRLSRALIWATTPACCFTLSTRGTQPICAGHGTSTPVTTLRNRPWLWRQPAAGRAGYESCNPATASHLSGATGRANRR